MTANVSGDAMEKMAKANATLLKAMYELCYAQQLNAVQKAQEALLGSQQDFSKSMTEAMSSGDSAAMAKIMTTMPLCTMRAQMLQGQKLMEVNNYAFEHLSQPMREAITSWQTEISKIFQENSGALTRQIEKHKPA
jgi:hypothetical protein